MIDFHTHILPNIDDGSSNVAESMEMLKMNHTPITNVIATPHFYPEQDKIAPFLEKRSRAYQSLLQEDYSLSETILLGAEVYFFDEISQLEGLSQLAIAGSPYILIEMPFAFWSSRIYKALYNITAKCGLVPIIAHIDRYLPVMDSLSKTVDRLLEMNVLIQMNSSFVLQRTTRRKALRLLEEERVQFIGSDCHNMTSRKPNLNEALSIVEKKLGSDMILKIEEHEQYILQERS